MRGQFLKRHFQSGSKVYPALVIQVVLSDSKDEWEVKFLEVDEEAPTGRFEELKQRTRRNCGAQLGSLPTLRLRCEFRVVRRIQYHGQA
jgi:hypothetical protein